MAKYAKIAVPAARSSAPVLAIRRRIILIALIAAAVLGLFASCTSLTSDVYVPPATTPSATNTVALAEEVARNYLDGVPVRVPVAENVDVGQLESNRAPFKASALTLSGVRDVPFGNSGLVSTQVRFMFQLEQPGGEPGEKVLVPYQIIVPMVLQQGSYPHLAAVPAVSPMVLQDGKAVEGLTPTLNADASGSQLQASSEVTKVINDWAKAYASGGVASEELKRVTGDPNLNQIYNGLGGWTANTVRIDGVMPPPSIEGATGFVVRVTLELTPPAGSGPSVPSSYDVWVNQSSAEQANPPVVAWGPAGTASQLTQYMNAETR